MSSEEIILSNERGTIKIPGASSLTQGDHVNHYKEFFTGQEADSYLINSSYNQPLFKYMFNTNKNLAMCDLSGDGLDFNRIVARMKSYTISLRGDFYEETENLEWFPKQAIFLEYAFFTATYIYIYYNATLKEYSFYIKSTHSTKEEDKNDYWNIETFETVKFPDAKALVRFNWDGNPVNDRYANWFALAYDMELYIKIMRQNRLLFNKRLDLSTDTTDGKEIISLRTSLMNSSPVLPSVVSGSWRVISTPPMPASELAGFSSEVYNWFDRETSELGRVANLNPKKERKTAGENYIAVDKQVDMLGLTLRQLNYMANCMEAKGWPLLSFKVNTEESIGMTAGEEAPETPEQTEN